MKNYIKNYSFFFALLTQMLLSSVSLHATIVQGKLQTSIQNPPPPSFAGVSFAFQRVSTQVRDRLLKFPVTTDLDAEFEIDLPPGLYLVVDLSVPGPEGRVWTRRPTYHPEILIRATEMQDLVIDMVYIAQVSGTVTQAQTGAPIAGAIVSAVPVPTGNNNGGPGNTNVGRSASNASFSPDDIASLVEVIATLTDSLGNYTLPLGQGEYFIIADSADFLRERENIDLTDDLTLDFTLDPAPDRRKCKRNKEKFFLQESKKDNILDLLRN